MCSRRRRSALMLRPRRDTSCDERYGSRSLGQRRIDQRMIAGFPQKHDAAARPLLAHWRAAAVFRVSRVPCAAYPLRSFFVFPKIDGWDCSMADYHKNALPRRQGTAPRALARRSTDEHVYGGAGAKLRHIPCSGAFPATASIRRARPSGYGATPGSRPNSIRRAFSCARKRDCRPCRSLFSYSVEYQKTADLSISTDGGFRSFGLSV